MVLHLPPFPARAGLGKSRHADFVILRVNTRGKNKSLCKAASCLCNRALGRARTSQVVRGSWQAGGSEAYGSFPCARSHRGKGLESRQLSLFASPSAPASRESAPGGLRLPFICQPACVSANAQLSIRLIIPAHNVAGGIRQGMLVGGRERA